ncbi:MFS transporter [Bacillus aerius]|uniref:MFS transporter n=1 Tax=Bacillus aerius TaxID=293388 RepID=UPI00281662B5|nr:MFS transporter [Bacillus aerius]WMT27631.1 MFS transporter [Bacillus aerius]
MSKFSLYWEILKNKYFSVLFLASFLNTLAHSIAVITIIWFIYQETNNPVFIAISLLCLELPSMLFAPIWGTFLDKVKIVYVVVFANLTRAVLFLFLLFNMTLITTVDFIIFFVLLSLSSSIAPIVKSGETMLLFRILPKKDLLPANSLMNIQFDLAFVIGPMLGGIIATTKIGPYAFLINFALLVFASTLFFFLRSFSHVKEKVKTVSKNRMLEWFIEFKNGITYIVKDKVVGSLVVLNFFYNLFIWGTTPTLLPILTEQTKNAGATGYGLLMASTSIGIIIGSILVGVYKTKFNPIYIVLLSLGFHGVFYSTLGLPMNIYFFALMLGIAGLISAPSMIYNRTIFQLLVPENKQGRIFTLLSTAGALGFPLGTITVAHITTQFGSESVSNIFLIFGLSFALITLIIGTVYMKHFNNYSAKLTKMTNEGV